MTGLTHDEIVENRWKFVNGLRENPQGFIRTTGALSDGHNGRCAVGAGCEYLGIPLLNKDRKPGEPGPYERLEYLLGYDSSTLWRMNDSERVSYGEVADEMATRWGLE